MAGGVGLGRVDGLCASPLHIPNETGVVRHTDPLERHEILDLMERVGVFC